MPVTGKEIVEALRRDGEARKNLAKLLAPELALEPSVRGVLAEAFLREGATKTDLRDLEARLNARLSEVESRLTAKIGGLEKRLEEVRSELEKEIRGVDERVRGLEQRLARVKGRLDLLVVFIVPLLVAVIGILLKMVFG